MEGFYPIASSSAGNCIYLQTTRSKVLIDCGISGKRIKEALASINVDVLDLDAILITHEHGDHIKGLRVLAFKYGIPVIANQGTAQGITEVYHDCPKFKIFATGESFVFQDLHVHPFSIQHDTRDPVAFTIHVDGLKLGFCTDLGFVTSLVRSQLQDCDYLYVEANHEPSMVHSSPRPMVYKQRVLGRSGHLSNEACGELLTSVYHDNLKHAHLAHLSGECNSPEVALKVVGEALTNAGLSLDLSVAHPNRMSRPIHFHSSEKPSHV